MVTSMDPSSGTITYRPQIQYMFSCLYPMQYLLNNTELGVWVLLRSKTPNCRESLEATLKTCVDFLLDADQEWTSPLGTTTAPSSARSACTSTKWGPRSWAESVWRAFSHTYTFFFFLLLISRATGWPVPAGTNHAPNRTQPQDQDLRRCQSFQSNREVVKCSRYITALYTVVFVN